VLSKKQIKLLALVVESQELDFKKTNKDLEFLQDLGFIFIKESSSYFIFGDKSVKVSSSLDGEAYLISLE
jgi:hypothetical protein